MYQQSNSRQHIRSAIVIAVLGLGFAGMSGAAQAEGWYGGVGAGGSKVKIDDSSINSDIMTIPGVTSSRTTSKDETDTGWKLFAGYKFNPNFALEGGYVDLGKFKLDTAITSVSGPGTAHSEIKATGWNIDAVGIVPLQNNFSVFARLGVIRPEVKLDVTATGPAGTASGSDKDTSSKAKYGLGVQYDFTKTVGLRGEWERYHNLGDKDKTGQGDVDLWSVNLVFNLQ